MLRMLTRTLPVCLHMASSSARNPKELRNMVAESHQDVSTMQASLARLKGLSASEKTENAMLQSRLDEQSHLIMILKQRSDEKSLKVQTVERINEELEEFRKDAVEKLKREMDNYNMLESRFNDLAENHEELIKIKDDYKKRNKELMSENCRLREDNAKLFSKAIQERDERITEMDKKILNLKESCSTFDSKNRGIMALLKSNEEKYVQDVKSLQRSLNEREERLKAAMAKVKQQEEGRHTADAETIAKIQSLTKEKDEMLDLAMQRGKVVQEKVSENKKLSQNIDRMEKSLRDMHLRFEREAAAVNANLQVQSLKMALEEAKEESDGVMREFEAFKKHSTNLLDKERQLNAKLRHLMS